MNKFYSDYWKSYAEVIQADRSIQSKKEIFKVEGYNSLIMHYLAISRRNTE